MGENGKRSFSCIDTDLLYRIRDIVVDRRSAGTTEEDIGEGGLPEFQTYRSFARVSAGVWWSYRVSSHR
jgi:hypothetical protein